MTRVMKDATVAATSDEERSPREVVEVREPQEVRQSRPPREERQPRRRAGRRLGAFRRRAL